ncbi:MAG: 1-acyl-sn-glycerol-3-phosphate acyltransferase [Candidatus Reconcilbacillus cellulovorans]|uniref:1-acyl-sn-glycerol-3-phosphate acyltransferase n=1 Tax=Candidatus Reconcilbacillus cellulovorans TaxID=1906605 RepID=A0A2A6DZ15_9BACL|nr:MAG: 1-acyl-sn-glycerol-3-phosphate acyltransferase [Candidatus Reconcilbacillus cellulovorans]
MLYAILQKVARIVFPLAFGLKAIGVERFPKDGPVVLCSNHVSYWDPPVLGTFLDRRIHFMAKEELFRVPGLAWLIVRLGAFPVRRGGVSKDSIRRALDLLAEGRVVGIFPAGTRKADHPVGKRGAAMLAVRSGALVVPAAIVGRYSPFGRLRVVYGEPIDPAREDGGLSEERLTERIMQAIEQLKKSAAAD